MSRGSSRIIYMKFKTRFHANFGNDEQAIHLFGDLGGLVVINFLDSNALH